MNLILIWILGDATEDWQPESTRSVHRAGNGWRRWRTAVTSTAAKTQRIQVGRKRTDGRWRVQIGELVVPGASRVMTLATSIATEAVEAHERRDEIG